MRLLPISALIAAGAACASAQPGEFPMNWLEADSEATWQSDILLLESGVRFEQEWSRLRWDASFTHNVYSEEYEPFRTYDLFGFNQTLHEERFAGAATVRPKLTDHITLIASGGVYDGFQDYRRVWLNNYYRQQYNNPRFPRRPGYEDADPKGWNTSAGLRWEYWREMGFAEARGAYGVDDVAPGFVEDPATGRVVRGRSRLYTTSVIVSFENVLSSRLRLLNEVRLGDTTERDVRVSWEGTLNCALGERWIFRPFGGYTAEDPAFEASWVGAALEFQVTSWWALIASAHYYHDTGEILDPAILTSAAPGLESRQFTLGARLTWSNMVLKMEGGPYDTDYDELPPNSRPFTNLYRNRNWALAQISLGLSF